MLVKTVKWVLLKINQIGGYMMPIFQYRCLKCSEKFEVILTKSSQTPKCPKCGNTHLQKLMTTAVFKFKNKENTQ